MTILLVLAAVAVGYAFGRVRVGSRLLSWGEDAARKGRRSPGWWCAQLIGVVALAWHWGVHPRRSLDNVRAWREAERRKPAPVYDPEWMNKR